MRGRDPEPIRNVLDEVLKGMGVARPLDVAQLVSNWDEIAGDPWAGRSQPVSLDGGSLVVAASDGAAASLLKYQVASLLKRLDGVLGQGLVTSVTVRVAPRGPRS